MRVLIFISAKLKANGYAENLFQSSLSFFAEQKFSIYNFDSLAHANKQQVTSNNTVTIIKAQPAFFPFFTAFQLRSFLTRHKIQYLIQITEDSIIKAHVPQLIICENMEKIMFAGAVPGVVKMAVSSKRTIQDLQEKTKIEDNNFVFIPFTANTFYQPVSWSEKQALKVGYTQGREYFFVYARDKSKAHFLSILKAFSAFKKWQRSSMKLLIEGNVFFANDEDWNEKLSTYKYREDVVFINNLEEETSARLLAGAYVFIHIPITDHDVLPLLQSMQCATPCISFFTEILKEYAENAAVLIEPGNYDLLGDKMILLYKDENLRSRLIDLGLVEAKRYSKENVVGILNKALLTTAEV